MSREPEKSEKDAKANVYDNMTLSTIIRFHDRGKITFLEEAIFSLAIQEWHDIETIIVLQNGTDEIENAVTEIINHQPWPASPRYKILSVNVREGMDGRSILLNHGMEHATGRFLAFLDYDDVVYHHGYTTLIQQLIDGGHAVAVGGCRKARIEFVSDHWFVKSKENTVPPNLRSRIDLFRINSIAIHSYVIDRSRLGLFDLYFDTTFTLHEDYDFLLRLGAAFDFDFSKLDVPVCEYRIHNFNSFPNNYLEGIEKTLSPEDVPAYERYKSGMQLIEKRRQSLMCSIPATDLIELGNRLEKAESMLAQLQSQESYTSYIIARKARHAFSNHPLLQTWPRRTLLFGLKLFKRIRHGVSSTH